MGVAPKTTHLAVASLVAASSYVTYRLVSRYGWKGSLWLIWEGSPYPPATRDRMETLDAVEASIVGAIADIEALEMTWRQERESSLPLISAWKDQLSFEDLPKHLAWLSDDLDRLAAKVDGVQSQGEPEIKQRKKSLSTRLVKLMERIDILIKAYERAQSTGN